MSSTRVLTSNQEVFLNFLNTHFAMAAFLMPWKKLVDTDETTKEVTYTHFITLFDMLSKKKWMSGAGDITDDLEGKVHILFGMTVTLLVVTILGFVASLFYTRETVSKFWIDVISLIMGSVTLILALTFQSDFDASWKFHSTASGAESVANPYKLAANNKRDHEQMFLVVGVIVGQIVLSIGLAGDKLREVLERWRV
jgi:hypothetical protein